MAETSKHSPPKTIEEWIAQVRAGAMSRRRFLTSLTVAGASAAGAAILVAHATGTHVPAHHPAKPNTTQQNLQLHQQHVARQQGQSVIGPDAGGSQDLAAALPAVPPHMEPQLKAILNDYHPDAIVEDTLHGEIIQGHAAIAGRKAAEMLSISQPVIDVTRRYAIGDEVVAEWAFSGIHTGEYKGYAPTGRTISIQGLTVVKRDAVGKIIREAIYYDAESVRRQLSQ